MKAVAMVIMDLREDVPKGRLKEYIAVAVKCWGGQFFPGDAENDADPLFNGFRKVRVVIAEFEE
jgi:hypothetical protein